LELGTPISQPLVEFYLKNDALGDPLLTEDRLRVMGLATPDQVQQLREMALRVNQVLSDFFNQCGITLVDFKLEFGVDEAGKLLLADEISPDTCRLWNQAESDPNRRVMDKDRFRRDLCNSGSASPVALTVAELGELTEFARTGAAAIAPSGVPKAPSTSARAIAPGSRSGFARLGSAAASPGSSGDRST